MDTSTLHSLTEALIKSSLFLFVLWAGTEVVVRAVVRARARMWIRLGTLVAAVVVLVGLLLAPRVLPSLSNIRMVEVGGKAAESANAAVMPDALNEGPDTVLSLAPSGLVVLTAGYLLGLCLVVGQGVASWWRVRRWVRRGEDLTVDWLTGPLAESAGKVRFCLSRESHGSPFLTSLIKPTIVLPASLWEHSSARVLHHVIRHELTHFRRGDLWWHGLAAVLFLPFYFHPAAWLMRAGFVRDLEISCDEVAAGPERAGRLAYAKSLAALAGMVAVRPGAAGLGFPGMLRERICELLAEPPVDAATRTKPRALSLLRCGGVAAALMVAGTLLFPLPLIGMPGQDGAGSVADGTVLEWRIVEFDPAIRLKEGERARDWLASRGVVMVPGSRAILKKGGKQLYARLSLASWDKLEGILEKNAGG